MKDNVGVIHFQIKVRGREGLVFVQITCEKCTKNFYFENDEVDIKKTIANLQPYEHETFLQVYAFLCSLISNENLFL